MHRSRFISDISPTNAIVPRDTIIQLSKSYPNRISIYFLKYLAARKRRAKRRGKGRGGGKEEEKKKNERMQIGSSR